METETVAAVLECLASPIRLRMYRALVREGSAGLVAGRIAAELDLPPSSASFHLKAMTHADLLSVQQEGRFQRYRANLGLMQQLVSYLTEECCAGHPELCMPAAATRVPVPRPGTRATKTSRIKR